MSTGKAITIVMRPETSSERRRLREDERRLNAHIGQLVRSWAILHDRFAGILHYLVAEENEALFRPSVGYSIWHTIKSDLLQRQILQAAIQANIDLNQRYSWADERKTKTKILEEYLWLLKETTKKSDARNDLVHGPIIFFLDYLAAEYEASISDISSDPRVEKLKGKDIYQYCSFCIDFCEKAMNYLHELSHYRNEEAPFPKRPRWLPMSHFPTRKQPALRKRRPKGFRAVDPASPKSS